MQRDALRAAAARLGYDVVAEVVDRRSAWKGAQADVFERKVQEAVVAARADVLMVWAVDRWTRRGPAHALGLIETLEKHHGVALYSLQEPFLSTATADPHLRELLVSLFAWMARQESERRSARIGAKAEAMRNRAAALGQRARWGRGSMPSEEDVAAVWALRRARDLGASVRGIAKATGLSKSTVGRILAGPEPVPREPEGQGAAEPDAAAPSRRGGLGHGQGPSDENAGSSSAVAAGGSS